LFSRLGLLKVWPGLLKGDLQIIGYRLGQFAGSTDIGAVILARQTVSDKNLIEEVPLQRLIRPDFLAAWTGFMVLI